MLDTKKKSLGFNVLAFSVPILLLLISYAFLSIFPFGNKSLIVYWDMREQYTVFFEYLKTMFAGQNDVFYTFSKFLGGDMVGLFAYYMSSPFNLLFWVFKNVNMAVMVLILTLLKTGFCGLTFNIYLSKKFKTDYSTILFATIYALSGYSIIYQQNIMWLDGMIFLPLVLLGIEQILSADKIWCYIISLAAAIISNYYIGYMIGIFSVLYFAYVVIATHSFEKSVFFKKIKLFLFSTFVSVGSTAILLLPTLKSLSGGKGPGSIKESSLLNFKNWHTFCFKPVDFLYRLFTGAFEWQDVLGALPFVFCGLSALILVILFFFNKKISKKEKVASGVFLLFMILSFQLDALNIIWHGFNFPTGFPGRNSFLFIALMILIAYNSFLNLKEGTTFFHVVATSAVMVIVTALVFFKRYSYYSLLNVLVPSLVITFTLLILALYVSKNNHNCQKAVTACLAVICSVDLVANAYMSLDKYHYENINEYNEHLAKYSPVYDYIKSNDPEIYRLEKYFRRTTNDAMMFNYSGLTSYSSSEKSAVKQFPEKLGLDRFSSTYASYSLGSTLAVDCLLGVKYLLSHGEPHDIYEKINTINDTHIYKNDWALPLGFAVSNKVDEVDLDMETTNRFEIQNNIFNAITNSNDKILYPKTSATIVDTRNVEVLKEDNSTRYKRAVKTMPGLIEFKFKVESEDPLYIDLHSPHQNGAYLIVDGKIIKNYFSTDDRDNLIKLGKQPIGKEISVIVNMSNRTAATNEAMRNVEISGFSNDQEILLDEMHVYYENIEMVKKKCQNLSTQPYNFQKLSSSHLRGTVTSYKDDQSLLLTLPYEKGWNVKVDGKKVKSKQVLDVLMAIDLEKGEHTVEMQYIPEWFYLGTAISVLSIILMLAYFYFYKKRKVESK